MTFHQFLIILWARRKLAIYTLGITVATTLIISLIWPKEYTATNSVVVDVKSPDPIAGLVLPAMISPGYMATQLDIIESDRVAARVVKMLGFEKNDEALQTWKDETDGKGSFERFYGDLLQKKLDVKPSRDSNVIDINFTAKDPQFAAIVANAFAQAYIDTTIELKVEPARQYANWFNERQKALRDNLEKAQAKLSSYQQDKGIVVTDERLDNETGRLNELTAQLAAAQAQRADANSRQKNGNSEVGQDVMQNPLIQNLKAELARAEAKLSELGNNVGKNHPQYQQAEANIAGLRQQLKDEIGRISSGLAAASRQGVHKEDELKSAIEEQKKRILELRSQRDEASVLLKDVENAQHAYEAVSQRMSQANLESQSQQTNVSVLSPATEPTEHSRPRILLNTLIAFFLGGMLGCGAAFSSELMDRKVRNNNDMHLAEGIPLLGILESEKPTYSYKDRWLRLLSRAPKGKQSKSVGEPA